MGEQEHFKNRKLYNQKWHDYFLFQSHRMSIVKRRIVGDTYYQGNFHVLIPAQKLRKMITPVFPPSCTKYADCFSFPQTQWFQWH